MLLDGGSPRFYINGKYQSVEFKSEFCIIEGTDHVYLSARNNHQTRKPPGFGGYPLYFDISDKSMSFKKEIIHGVEYSESLNLREGGG
jgi:hypothetical protein